MGIALVSHDYTLLSIPFSTLFYSTLRRVALWTEQKKKTKKKWERMCIIKEERSDGTVAHKALG